MPGNAALLIDLENFYIGREQNCSRAQPGEVYEFPVDLDSLCAFARDIAGGRRLIVQRAYANFNDRRPGDGEKRWDYYLQPQPRFLMEQGIEPVQVFRFPGGNNKNAADMKMAMDATALLQSPSNVDLFVIVTGDSDFIPLVLELKRSGAECVVIGVSHCTKPIFERYCDRFEYFEDLLAARELQRNDKGEIEAVKTALQVLIEKRAPIKFAAVKPLLSDELGFRFDPTRFGCESTGDFLRKFAAQLAISVRRGDHDWELVAPGDPTAMKQEDLEAAVRTAAARTPAIDDSDSVGDADGAARASRFPAPRVAPIGVENEQHSVEIYRDLLRQGLPRCYVVSYDDWNMIVDAVFNLCAPADGQPAPKILHQDLLTEVADQCTQQGMRDAARKVRDVCFQLFKAGCFHCAEDGSEPGVIDFHWSRKAMLDPTIEDVDGLVERAWKFLAQLLWRRLEQRGYTSGIQEKAFLELVAGNEPTDEDVDLVHDVVERMRAPAE